MTNARETNSSVIAKSKKVLFSSASLGLGGVVLFAQNSFLRRDKIYSEAKNHDGHNRKMMIENFKPENLLRVSQIAELLGVSKTTVRAILNNGTIPYIRIGGRNRVLKADLENYLLANTYRQDLKLDAE